jgi:hypothetical protein
MKLKDFERRGQKQALSFLQAFDKCRQLGVALFAVPGLSLGRIENQEQTRSPSADGAAYALTDSQLAHDVHRPVSIDGGLEWDTLATGEPGLGNVFHQAGAPGSVILGDDFHLAPRGFVDDA